MPRRPSWRCGKMSAAAPSSSTARQRCRRPTPDAATRCSSEKPTRGNPATARGLIYRGLAPGVGQRQADFREFRYIFVLVDGDIAALPVGQRGGMAGARDVEHAPDHDGMGVTL